MVYIMLLIIISSLCQKRRFEFIINEMYTAGCR